MVTVVERTTEMHSRKERDSKLAKIAKEVCGWKYLVCDTGYGIGITPLRRIALLKIFPTIHIHSRDNSMSIKNKGYIDIAKKLAEAYEAAGEPEFTVNEDY